MYSVRKGRGDFMTGKEKIIEIIKSIETEEPKRRLSKG